MNIEQQFDTYWKQITTRKRNPPKGATLAAYSSYHKTWIGPHIGQINLSEFENGAMKKFVSKLADSGLSASSIAGITNCVKGIISSATDDNGNELFPRKWNSTFIDAPPINSKDQDTPILGQEALQGAISRTHGQFRTLCILLAGSGLRINEALALKTVNHSESSFWDSKESKLVIKKALWRGIEQLPKTTAGEREVDLSPELNAYLLEKKPESDFLFAGSAGNPLRIRTVYDMGDRVGIPGFHSLRRQRVTHLRTCKIPEDIIKFWIGHSSKDITDRYSKMSQNIEARKKYAVEAGLGFQLPLDIL